MLCEGYLIIVNCQNIKKLGFRNFHFKVQRAEN